MPMDLYKHNIVTMPFNNELIWWIYDPISYSTRLIILL